MALILMLSGWAICLAALLLLPTLAPRLAFILTGLAIQILGLALLAHAYRALLQAGSRR
jgi:hypothetical protein